MLRTNLSTRPFYSERAVHTGLTVAALVLLGVTAFNVFQIVVLSRRQSELGSQAATQAAQASELRAHAAQVRQTSNQKQIDTVSNAAREANAIIGQRLFSWTDLLNRLEATLPENVRLTSMRPRFDRDQTVTVLMTVVGRGEDDVNQFMANLEGTGVFKNVYSPEDITTEDGLLQATIEAQYVTSRPAAVKAGR